MGYERSRGGIPCVSGRGSGACGCIGSGLPPIGSGALAIDVIPEDFPVGARAILATPTKDYSGQTITTYKRTSSGNWVTLPGQLEYFTSFGELLATEDVDRVIDAAGKILYPRAEEDVVEIPELPEFETVDPPPPTINPPNATHPLQWPARAPEIMRDKSGQWIGYADFCDRLPYPGEMTVEDYLDEAERHLGIARDAVKTAKNCVNNIPPEETKKSYCNLYIVPDWIDFAFDYVDEAFCDCVDAYKLATKSQRDDVVRKMIDVVHAGLRELRAIVPIIAAALSRAYAEGYSQGWIDGFIEGYEEGVADREDQWDKFLDDLKGMLKVGVPVALFVVGGLALLGGVGWAVSKWRK